MSHLRAKGSALFAALAIALGLGLAIPAAHAATAAPARPATAGDIFGPCNSLQFGEYRVIGRYPNSFLIECVYVPGLGGYYWVRVSNSCGAATAPARETRAC